ncbi:MAG: prepilin peptidase [Rhodobacteraceae bacterium]|nr:prepilin peptidase [Paracoccaceae bacterium]
MPLSAHWRRWTNRGNPDVQVDLTASEALWLLAPALPVAIYVAFSDLKSMRIPNTSVLVMLGVFLVAGLIALPMEEYLWRLANFAVVLAIGFVANALRLVGGGDAKYAAAIAPFFAFSDIRLVLILFAIMLVSAFLVHRLFRAIGPIRRLTKGWKSWDAGKDFPMGLALSGLLIAYLGIGALQ